MRLSITSNASHIQSSSNWSPILTSFVEKAPDEKMNEQRTGVVILLLITVNEQDTLLSVPEEWEYTKKSQHKERGRESKVERSMILSRGSFKRSVSVELNSFRELWIPEFEWKKLLLNKHQHGVS